jgi:hypothetical protein
MPASEELKAIIERVLLLPVRLRHRHRARPKHKGRQAAIATTTNTLRRAGDIRAESIRTVFNVSLYLLLLDQDLADFTDDLVNAIGDRRRRFIAKHEAVLLYESAENLPKLLGKEFRSAVRAIGAADEVMSRLNAVSSDLNSFWKDNRAFLGAIRNAVAAHREHDALRYIEILNGLEPLDVMRRAAAFSDRLERLIRVLTEIGGPTGSPMAVVRDVLSSRSEHRSRKDNL